MQVRRLGRTGHMSSIAIFGSFAFSKIPQAEADAGMEQVIQAGVNHIDVAPTYGEAELRLAPWMKTERERFFLGCKTMERKKEGAAAGLRRSLERLQVDRFDLFQLHAITSYEELDQVTAPGGALEALIAAREEGLTRWIGITGHDMQVTQVFLEALNRYDFDTVLFPINPVLYAYPDYRKGAETLLRECRRRDVGTMIIKSAARRPWGGRPHPEYNTWYEPYVDMDKVQQRVNFVLSQDVTGLITSGDLKVMGRLLEACENFSPMPPEEQEALVASAEPANTVFPIP